MDAATVTVAPAELVGLFRDQAADQGEVGLVEWGRGGRGGAQPRREMVVSLTGRVGRPSAGPELLAVLELLAELRYTFLFLPGDKFGGGGLSDTTSLTLVLGPLSHVTPVAVPKLIYPLGMGSNPSKLQPASTECPPPNRI